MTTDPPLSLEAASRCLDFLIHSTCAFCFCWLASLVLRHPRQKFILWLSFLLGTTGYWLWLLAKWVSPLRAGTSAAPSVLVAPAGIILQASHPAPVWNLPLSWAPVCGTALAFVGCFYLLLVAYLCLCCMRSHLKLRSVLRFTVPASSELESLFQQLKRHHGVSHCEVRILSGIASPATAGWLKPIVLLPDHQRTAAPTGLCDVLNHELHHVKRNDYFWDNVASLCRILLFFQPATLFAVKQLRFERELVCDLAVINHAPDRRAEYAESLLRFAQREKFDEPAWGIDFAAHSGHLKTRLQAILLEPPTAPAWRIRLRTGVVLFSLLGVCAALPLLGVELRFTPLVVRTVSGLHESTALLKQKAAVERLHHRTIKTPAVPGALAKQTEVPVAMEQPMAIEGVASEANSHSIPAREEQDPSPTLAQAAVTPPPVNVAPAQRPPAIYSPIGASLPLSIHGSPGSSTEPEPHSEHEHRHAINGVGRHWFGR